MSGLPIIQFIILQIIVLAVVIFILKKVLYTDTESAVARLNRVYQDLLAKQKDLTIKIETAEKDYQEKREEATRVATSLKSQAIEEIRAKEDEIVKKAKAEGEEVIARARNTSDNMRLEIEKEVKEKMIHFVIRMMGVVFKKKLTAVIHRELVREFLERGKDIDLSTVGPHINKLTVRTAMPLTDEEMAAVKDLMSLRFSRPMEIDSMPDKNLIAGMCFQFGTLLVDGSLANAFKEAEMDARKKLQQEEADKEE